MNDNELISLIIDDLYLHVSCSDIIKMLKEDYGVEIEHEHARLLCRMTIATGFAKDIGISCGPHWTIRITDEGMKMKMEYGSYLRFLNSKTSNAMEQANEAKLKRTNIKVNICSIVIGIILSIISILLAVYTQFQDNRIHDLEKLLKEHHIEIPK